MKSRINPLSWLMLFGVALLLAGPGAWGAAANAEASVQEVQGKANCLAPVGRPWESGDNVYIKVKNNCTKAVGFTWEVGTHKFGAVGTPIGTPETGSRAVKPGKTTTICAKKPADKGRYCFKFKIKSKDQTKPGDTFTRWLNNIEVAMIPGGAAGGTLEVGGGGLASDVVLAASAPPPGWSMDLSAYYVSTPEFPATLAWEILAPRDAAVGERAYFRVDAFDADTGEFIAEAEFYVSVRDGETVPNEPLPRAPEGAAPGTGGDSAGDGLPPEPPEEDPIPVEPPDPRFFTASSQNELPIVGREILLIWDENADFGAESSVVVEVLGPDGWEEIGTDEDRAKESPLGILPIYWDTTDLPAGDYPVRVIMTNEAGKVATTEQVLTVTKAPVAEASASFRGSQVILDGQASYDPDGSILDWRWDFGDGTTVTGPVVTRTLDEPGEIPVDLTVTDLEGNETTAYCTLETTKQYFACYVRSCGCESMKIKDEDDTASIDQWWMPAGDKKKLGPITPPQPMPAGGKFNLQYNFEVEATLVDGSDPSKCTSEQWVNRSSSVGDKKDKDGNEFPYGSDDYAPDNYTGDSTIQKSDGGKIRWVDGPGLWGLTPGWVGANGGFYRAQFFAMVSGPLGTCQCTWEVVMEIDKTGKPVEGPELKNVDCS